MEELLIEIHNETGLPRPRLGPKGMADAGARIVGAEVGELREKRATVYMRVRAIGDDPDQITTVPMRRVRRPGERWLIVEY